MWEPVLYDGSVADEAYRLELSEKTGLGVEIPLVVVPKIGSFTEKPGKNLINACSGVAWLLTVR
jgi:hypothetical protein